MFLILATDSDQGLSPFYQNNCYLEEPLFFMEISFYIFSSQHIQILELRMVSFKLLLHLSGHSSVQSYLKIQKQKKSAFMHIVLLHFGAYSPHP